MCSGSNLESGGERMYNLEGEEKKGELGRVSSSTTNQPLVTLRKG